MNAKEVFGEYLTKEERILYWAKGDRDSLGVSDKRIIEITPHQGTFRDIDLAHVTSVDFVTNINYSYLIFAAIGFMALFLGLSENSSEVSLLGFVVGVIFVLAYFFSKKRVLNVSTEKDVFTYTFTGAQAEEIGLNFVKYIRKGMRSK